jgi:RNA recognition motif-containing protein
VKEYLSQFGPLLNCRLAFFKNGNLKGFGFAEFENPADSLKACGKNHLLNGKKVRV